MPKISENISRGRPAVGQRRSVQVSDEDWQRWAEAAEQSGKTRAEWMREALNQAAKQQLNRH